MIDKKNLEENCTGCSACEKICNVNAIVLNPNEHGFMVPFVDEKKCTHCGMCLKVCHLNQDSDSLFYKKYNKVFAARNKKEDIRLESSSGGVFDSLARAVLNQNGVVYGVSFDSSFKVIHCRIENMSEIEQLRGSKYVQSDIQNALTDVEKDLCNNVKVLFSGTPCQIAGLLSYLKIKKIDLSNLITVEIVCHGVPSPLVWNQYLETLKFEKKKIFFRSKKDGWHARIKIRIDLDNGTLYEDSSFTELFLADLITRDSCHQCRYATKNRIADITLCDFWGIENTKYNFLDDDRGVSGVILNSDKSIELWKEIENDFLVESVDYEDISRNQKTMNEPYSRPPVKNSFWNDFYAMEFKQLVEKYINPEYLSKSYNYIVVASDGSGSKGDEGMLRGLLKLLNYEDVLLISPNEIYPCTDCLPDIKNSIDEICCKEIEIEKHINQKTTLIIVGADVVDGTCGLESSLSRIAAMKKMLEFGGKVFCFSSFRSNVNDEIIIGIKEISSNGNSKFFVRDEISKNNFKNQIGIDAEYFPDFAFYCDRNKSDLVENYLCMFEKKKSMGYKIIGLNFSEQSFTSFYNEKTVQNRLSYLRNTFENINSVEEKPFFVLLSNDVREWDGHLSDSSYQKLASKYLTNEGINDYVIINPEISYPEMIEVLANIDYLISARMHLSIAAIRCGTIPIVLTGNGSSGTFSMNEKVEGMLKSRLGRTDLLATDFEKLPDTIRVVNENKYEIIKVLNEKNLENEKMEKSYEKALRKLLNVNDSNNISEDEALFVLKNTLRKLRYEYFSCKNKLINSLETERDLKGDLGCKNAHIEQLLESERNLQGELGCKNAHIEQLIESERKYVRIQNQLNMELKNMNDKKENLENKIEDLSNQLKRLNEEITDANIRNYNLSNELKSVYSSRSWRFTKPYRKLAGLLRKFKLLKFVWHCIKYLKNKGLKATLKHTVERFARPKIEKPKVVKSAVYKKIRIPVSKDPMVSIIIPVYNQFAYTYDCIKSIVNTVRGIDYEIIIGDDLSTDKTKKIHSIFPDVIVNKNKTDHGFLMNCNRAAKLAKGKYILFLNNDTQVQENWLSSLVTLIESDEKIGMVGSKLIYPNGTLQEAGGIIWNDASGWNYGWGKDPALPEFNYVKEVDYISGASIMIKADLWKEIGGFDERYKPAYCEDSDLAFEVRKHGYKVMYQPQSVVVHFEGVSNGKDLNSGLKKYQVENSQKFKEKWADELKKQCPNAYKPFLARERSQGRKVVVFIDHYVPTFDKDAGSKTTFQYIKMFLMKGYSVKFIGDNYAFKEMEPYSSTLLQLGVEYLYGSWYANHIFEWLKENENEIDVCYMNRPHITEKYIDFVRNNTNIKIIYYGHDLHFLRMKREAELANDPNKLVEADYWKNKEFEIMRKASVSYYPSYVEEDAVKAIDPSINVKAINAYLFDTENLSNSYKASDRRGLLFVGGFSHAPNGDAVRWFVKNVYSKIRERDKNIDFYIVGSNTPEDIKAMDGNGVIVKGFVSEEELASLYASCRIVIVPLRYGAGVKGKVVEALYNGLPIVTTSVGAEGIPGVEYVAKIADDSAEIEEIILTLYNDYDELNNMAALSSDYVKKHFSIEAAWNIVKGDFQ